MTSLPQPPAPSLRSSVLGFDGLPPPQGPFSPARASMDLSPIWLPKGPGKSG